MTESRATRLRSARKFGNMEIEGRRLIWRGPLCAVFGEKNLRKLILLLILLFFLLLILLFLMLFLIMLRILIIIIIIFIIIIIQQQKKLVATPDWQATCHAFTFRGGTTVTGITTITVTTINDDSSQHCAGWRFTD